MIGVGGKGLDWRGDLDFKDWEKEGLDFMFG